MARRPNILLFLPDGMQARAVDPRGPCVTPHFDRLGARGLRFTRAYTPNATCSPARASLMTGLLPHNHGVLHVEHTVADDQSVLRRDQPHFAQRLSEAGYRTGYFGKWHIERSNRLADFGWQVSSPSQRAQLHPTHIHRAASAEGELLLSHHTKGPAGYGDRLHYAVTDAPPEARSMGQPVADALEFLDDVLSGGTSGGWCCVVSFSQPNEAMIAGRQAFERYDVDKIALPATLDDDLTGRPAIYRRTQAVWRDMTPRQWREALACYYASITELDALFGKLVERIGRAGQLDHTIVIVTSDHGRYVGEHGMDGHNFGAFEPIYRIPLLVAGPGISRGMTDARVGLHDLCPTLLELAGAEAPASPDSHSFTPVLRDPRKHEADFSSGYAESEGTRFSLTQRVVWDGPWKFVFNGFDFDELYNLDDDPDELQNLAGDPGFRGRVERMTALMWRRATETGDQTLVDTHYAPMRIGMVGPEQC